VNLVVGARGDQYEGWVSTERAGGAQLDIRQESDWRRYFAPGSIDRIVCEHVLEHMTFEDGFKALSNFRTFLKPGGFARIAVPDAHNPGEAYQQHSAPGGIWEWIRRNFLLGADEPGHIVHYDYSTLTRQISRAGLSPRLLEWFDEAGRFHRQPWNVGDAPVKRYFNSPMNLHVYLPVHGFQNISLLVDAAKV
jgi:predicted SAM-dependent methyltransferase